MKSIAAATSLLLLVFPTTIMAVIGGRCSGTHNDDGCICLDRDACEDRYAGSPVQGTPGNYACPSDPANVWGCYITDHCPTKGTNTWCRWKEACRHPIGGGKSSLYFTVYDGGSSVTDSFADRPGLPWEQ